MMKESEKMNNKIITYEDLRSLVSKYINDDKKLNLIEKAYEFSLKHFESEKRLTGEPYIFHPLTVAIILAEIKADCETICGALLHDILERDKSTVQEIKKEFNEEIASLVAGVTKINKLSFTGDNEAVLANHRKIIVGLSEDVRVIIIKLADRLHNLQTLWVLPEATQKEKAKETLDILVPIAHRLGMNKIKGELEDLSLRYYKPDVYFSIIEKLNQSKSERDNIVIQMQNAVSGLLNDHGIKHEIKGRAKSIFSIYKKLDKGKRFSDIYDLLALRVFVDTEQDCYQALGIIHSKFKPMPKRFKDYIAMPKTNMYQSLHTTVFGLDSNLFEIQIRTYEMDQVAENGIASHWSYKEHGSNVNANLQNDMEQKLQFFKSIMDLKKENINEEEFVNSAREDLFKNTIYVFTPKGDVVELPSGSTPIDFAYRVHSRVGDTMVGAIVNSIIVPLDYELKDNDIIKINTNKNSSGPNREWINMAKTSQAKNKIKAFFNRIDKDDNQRKGEEILTKELRKKKISQSDFFTDTNINKILQETKCGDMNELYIGIGSNKFTPNQIINIIIADTDSKEEIILKKVSDKEVNLDSIKADIIVEGIDDIKVNISSCCKPIPGDRIVGYITKGKGISVHRMVCPNVSELEERTIDVNWNKKTSKKYPTTILVHASEENNVLVNIISKTSNNNITVESIKNISTNENHLFHITILVEDKEKLIKFMNDINSIPNILDVERLIK
ncbi:MAG: bifunctional (p)ppGpp synthetase/guanosine-3',5'-bis(diphosphate) 3'-pyrophosphohydrolase [Firmicutes bacterium]|nr:bifunctional (p)ppGpp synthetase/guanosine-3',5'-bis(diphosphate) 3'-pyrophosphohydrolase [Bacillota bacterium]